MAMKKAPAKKAAPMKSAAPKFGTPAWQAKYGKGKAAAKKSGK